MMHLGEHLGVQGHESLKQSPRGNSKDEAEGAEKLRHRIFDWVECNVGEDNDDWDGQYVASKKGVPQRILLQHINDELSEEESLLSLPFALMILVTWAICYTLHDRATTARDVEDAITFDLEENANFAFSSPGFMGHKCLYDVNTYADFYSWLRVGLQPLMLAHYNAVPEDVDVTEEPPSNRSEFSRKFYLNYNTLIGGIRMQQVSAAEVPLVDKDLGDAIYGKNLVSIERDKFDLDLNYKPTVRDMMVLAKPVYNEERTRWMLLSTREDQLIQGLKDLEEEEWIREDTVTICVNFLTYNAHTNSLTFSMLNVLQSRSGHFWRTVTHETMSANIFGTGSHRITSMVFDALLILLLLYLVLAETLQIWREYLMHKHVGHTFFTFFKRYVGFWNCVDWLSFGLGFLVIGLYFQMGLMVMEVRELLLDSKGDKETIARAIDFTVKVSGYLQNLRILCVFFPGILALRLFKAFAAQPRLALVTRTVYAAAIDLAHFGIAFVSVFGTFAVLGIAIFGREVREFATFPRAVETSFNVLMGAMEWDDLKQAGKTKAAVWFWIFTALVNLIMLNMVLGILMDAYTDVMGKTANAETMCEQVYEFWRRAKMNRQGLRVSLKHIHKSYTKHVKRPIEEFLETDDPRGHDLIMPSDFVNIIPGLKEAQALRLLTGAATDHKQCIENEQPLGLADAMGTLQKIVTLTETLVGRQKLQEEQKEKREANRLEMSGSNEKTSYDATPTPQAYVAPLEASAPQVPAITSLKAAIPSGGPQAKVATTNNLTADQIVQMYSPESAPVVPGKNMNGFVSGLMRSSATMDLGTDHDCGTLLAAAQVALGEVLLAMPREPLEMPAHAKGCEALAGFLWDAMEVYQRINPENPEYQNFLPFDVDPLLMGAQDNTRLLQNAQHRKEGLGESLAYEVAATRRRSVGFSLQPSDDVLQEAYEPFSHTEERQKSSVFGSTKSSEDKSDLLGRMTKIRTPGDVETEGSIATDGGLQPRVDSKPSIATDGGVVRPLQSSPTPQHEARLDLRAPTPVHDPRLMADHKDNIVAADDTEEMPVLRSPTSDSAAHADFSVREKPTPRNDHCQSLRSCTGRRQCLGWLIFQPDPPAPPQRGRPGPDERYLRPGPDEGYLNSRR